MLMPVNEPVTLSQSSEWKIDGRLEELADKILRGVASSEDLSEYKALLSDRMRAMLVNERRLVSHVRARSRLKKVG